jgi:gamma-glutamyltranspeptidase/glutathione hydrolase
MFGRRILAAGFVFGMLAGLTSCNDTLDIDEHRRADASTYMIAVAHPLAAQAGRDILAKGGSAVDAAIAAEMVLTLVEPQSSGIGGGAFMVHHDASANATETYDGREAAPASARPDMFLDSDGKPIPWPKAALGGRAVGVPGLLRMLALAHGKHGILPWGKLFEPAIRLAEDGFTVTPRLAGLLAADTELPGIPGTREYFYPDGKPLAAGSSLKNPALAKVLRTVAENGAAAFYTGGIAAGIAETVSTAAFNPVEMTAEDLAGYVAKQRDPVCVSYRVYRVCGMGPPSSGGILVGQILGMLEHFDLAAMKPFSAEAVHLIVEASRLAFADRTLYVADSDFVPVPVSGLLNPGYLASRARLISPATRMEHAKPGRAGRTAWRWQAADDGEKGLSTTHFTVRDKYGNVVSMTATIERAFGSKHMTQGFLLNNELTDFSFRPISKKGRPVANAPAPGKRPRSTMSPTIVYDAAGKPVLAIGSPGGSRIAGYTLKVILGVLDWHMHVADAIAAPNIVSRGGPVDIEAGTAAEALKPALEALGHEVKLRTLTSGLHGIEFHDGRMSGGADPRREGIVLGDAD